MPLDLERDEESIPYDEQDDWFNDVWNLWTSDIVSKVRSDTEIILLEARFIEENTELEPEMWIRLYWEKFRKIVTEHPEYTDFQIKYFLYKK